MTSNKTEIESLYASERLRLERVAMHKVGRANAADVVQDVFAAIWSRAKEQITLTPAYLTRATQYSAISQFRAEQSHERLLQGLTEEQYAPPQSLPDQIVAARQDLRRLQEALAMLPERTRQVFLLNRLHGCTYDEIAIGLDVSYSTVEREIARALLACKNSQ